ncbi:MAG: CotH kinase family protein [Planctomycetes bacterium]|nr:CotH kinase family protein [Planctomycetota bacterium]
MHRRMVVLCVVLGLMVGAGPVAPFGAGARRAWGAEEGKSTAVNPADAAPFGLTQVGAWELELTAAEYEGLQPPAAGFGPPGGPGAAPTAPPARKAGPQRASERNLFNVEFPWAHATLRIGDKAFQDVGLRYSGEMTYFSSAQSLKRPLKIELNRFVKQDLAGLVSLQLHAMPMDPAKGREILAFSMFRSVGVPAPRVGLAEVSLTVPGKFEKTLLGFYLVVENIDSRFLKSRFETEQGLLLKPFQVRSVDFLGTDWGRYAQQYRPQSEPTAEQQARVQAFARLVNESSAADFQKEIAAFLDVDAFLRFLAAHALTSNLESAVALGHNYFLYLHPQTGKFYFLPGDLEFALGNFLLFGTAEQLMDLSITHPYPGDNKLVERLLGIAAYRQQYLELLKQALATDFTVPRLTEQIATIEALGKEPRVREKQAADARREMAANFGPPGGAAPQPPSLRTFVEKRVASITDQLAGKSPGYVPAGLQFGPPPGAGAGGPPGRAALDAPIDEKTFRDVVQAPAGFQATLFAAPPRVGYPVALAATPGGELFVAVDEQGSIGRTPGGGKILRCVDRDGDGKVDDVTVFAKVDHPRGLIYADRSLWVLHGASLSVFRDGGQGAATASEELVTGLTSDMLEQRGGDHATNGIRLGYDGWIYIAVGDYGCPQARAKDGSHVAIRGGILRVRPDGTELEVYATGLRNPFDIAIDPFMNLFTRDNDDNRAGGWDIRVTQLFQGAYYGYSQHYANFPEEIMPPLGQFGGGSGVGALYLQDERWPEKYRNVLYTGDWGRSEFYRHELTPRGPTFALQQEVFLKIPRPTGVDLDGSGRLFVASWRGGEASTYVGPNVGFIARITPPDFRPVPFPDLTRASVAELLAALSGPNAVARLHSQREILRRGRQATTSQALAALSADGMAPLAGRSLAILTLKQLDGPGSHPTLLTLAQDSAVGEFALRALTDRKSESDGLNPQVFAAALADPAPRVRAQALISLARLPASSVTAQIVPLTSRPDGSEMPRRKEVHAQPDPDRVIPHLAVRALITLQAAEACLDAIEGPHAAGAFQALRQMHDPRVVDGLVRKLGSGRSIELRRQILSTLVRLYYREADYTGNWWGIRPENTGPYFDPVEWSQSPRIAAVLKTALLDADPETDRFLRLELARHQVGLDGVSSGPAENPEELAAAVVLRPVDKNNPHQIGNLSFDEVSRRALGQAGDAARGRLLFKAQSCGACHTDADGQAPKGPHLVDIGKRYSPAELLESILKPSIKIAQGFESYVFETVDGKVFTGFIVSQRAKVLMIRDGQGQPRELRIDDIENKVIQKQSQMPEGVVNNLTPEELADLIAYLRSLVNR